MQKVKKTESDTLEFKSCKGKRQATLPEDLWALISALANTRGGSIYLGVADSGYIEDLSAADIDKLQKDTATLLNGNKFNKKPEVDIVYRDSYVELIVKESPFYDKPIFSRKLGEKVVYIRHGTSTVKADDNQKKSMFASATGGGENQLIDDDVFELVNPHKVDEYIARTGLKNIDGLSLTDKLRKLKAFRQGKLTVFGLIAFGKDDEVDSQLNNTYIDFKYFNGKEKVNENLADIYKDRKEFHGDIKRQFDEAFGYLMGYIRKDWPVGGVLNRETGLREDVYVLPADAFREALANAVAHRDYAIGSSCVNVDLYSDRVEMTNPGESLVAIEDLENTESRARNPILMGFLKAFDVTDKSARGILTIKQAARKKGLLDPKFENISGSFKATLYFSEPHSGRDGEWVRRLASQHGLKDTQQNALVYIKNNQDISNRDYCEINHMTSRNDDRKARRELGDMVDKGIVKVIGKGPGTRYVLV